MKLHPLSLPYRAVSRAGSVAVSLAFAAFAVSSGIEAVTLPVALGVAVVGLLAAMGYEAAYYRRFEYDLTESTLDIESGVLSRRRREIPLGRVQNVDISRNVVQRALGIAAVSLETAGGGETEASLEYVEYEEAKRLQREIQRRKRGASAAEDGEDGERDLPDETELFALSNDELALLSALSFDPRLVSALFLLIPLARPLFSGSVTAFDVASVLSGVLGLLLTGLTLWALSAAITFARYYGFRLTRIDDELRYERGLVQRYDGSIPLDKVQTVTVRDNPLKRRFGYATLAIETAGYSPGQSGTDTSAAVPLAERDRVLELARSVEPFDAPSFERPPKRARRRYAGRYAIAVGVLTAGAWAFDWATGWLGVWFAPLVLLAAAPVAAHYKWLHRGYHVGDDFVVTRNGFWRRATKVVPYYRLQTVVQTRTLFQRRWRLATVVFDTASSVSLTDRGAQAVDIDADTAAELRELVADRLQAALRERRTTVASPGEDAAGD